MPYREVQTHNSLDRRGNDKFLIQNKNFQTNKKDAVCCFGHTQIPQTHWKINNKVRTFDSKKKINRTFRT